jgi:hypothetical protein
MDIKAILYVQELEQFGKVSQLRRMEVVASRQKFASSFA